MWPDLQQTFFIVLAPLLQNIIFPVFVAAGVLLAILMPLSRFWEPTQKIELDAGGLERDPD